MTNGEEYLAATDPYSADTDRDGAPDGWEVDNRLDPLTDDSAGDPDDDGATNIQEYQAGTNPQSAPPPAPKSGGGGGASSALFVLFLTLAAIKRTRRGRSPRRKQALCMSNRYSI